MRVAGVIALSMLSFAGRSEASCVDLVGRCFCPPQAYRVGVVVTEAVDGGTATVRVESSQLGLTVDGGLSLPVSTAETPGARWLLLGDERRPVDAAGKVTCGEFPGVSLAVETAASAAVSASCVDELAAAGVKQPPCNDTRGCSIAPLALLPLLAGMWLFRRRVS